MVSSIAIVWEAARILKTEMVVFICTHNQFCDELAAKVYNPESKFLLISLSSQHKCD